MTWIFFSAGQSFFLLMVTICMATKGLKHALREYRHVVTDGLTPTHRQHMTGDVRSIEAPGIIVECDRPWPGGGRVVLDQTEDRIITQDMFQTVSKCQGMFLFNLNISDISDSAFTSMPKLDTLHITGNHFASVRRLMFSGTACQALYLTNNQILFLESQAFADIKSLFKLDLSRNPLTGPINPDTFRISSLRSFELRLSFTGVVIEQGLFQNIPNLRRLYLNGNLFKYTPNIFQGLGLSHLSIENANITQVNKDTWEGLGASLKYLL